MGILQYIATPHVCVCVCVFAGALCFLYYVVFRVSCSVHGGVACIVLRVLALCVFCCVFWCCVCCVDPLSPDPSCAITDGGCGEWRADADEPNVCTG